MRDLAILVPSRGRSESVIRLITACTVTCKADTQLFFAFDRDDPALGANIRAVNAARFPVSATIGERKTMAAWTNELAEALTGEARHLASLGDDHVPRTERWDVRLLEAIARQPGGVGIAYGNDLLQGPNLPTAPVISSSIVTALGWMCEPSMRHYCVDNVWRDLGQGAGCLVYEPHAIIEHCHVFANKALPDATHNESITRDTEDQAAYDRWRVTRRQDDVDTVCGVILDAMPTD